jgi:hypothetical protein
MLLDRLQDVQTGFDRSPFSSKEYDNIFDCLEFEQGGWSR